LRNRQILRAKFRRQHSIEKFIVDFYCNEAQLVIEVDGPVHEYTPEEDAIRQEFLESLGFTVLRFTNDEILNLLGGVIEKIMTALNKADFQPDSPSLRSGEGARGEVGGTC
jgi:very-short-patch-repair endonuclease